MSANRMSWTELLDETRILKALEGKRSVKAEMEARSEFERDRDRTVYSNPVRRLIGKTQVFPLDPNDHVRTRLIHSLEVSTVAEDLASQVVREIISKRESLDEEQRRAISKIAETCGLLHDLGNPPFGHAGELAIASWFEQKRRDDELIKDQAGQFFFPLGGPESQKSQDFLRFEGNAQTMRILTNTHLLGHDHGLNLTCATTAAARKYLASSLNTQKHGPDHAYAKPGYFFSEAEIVKLVSDRTGTEGRRHPITFLVESADDIVYSVVDIEDGLKKRILNWRQVREFLEKRCGDSKLFAQTMKRTTEQLASGYTSDSAFGQAFRVNAISELVLAAVRMVMILDACYSAESIESGDFKPGPMGSRGLGQLAYDKRVRVWRRARRRNRRARRVPRQEAAFLGGPKRGNQNRRVREQSRSFADAGRRKSPEAVPRPTGRTGGRPNGTPCCWMAAVVGTAQCKPSPIGEHRTGSRRRWPRRSSDKCVVRKLGRPGILSKDHATTRCIRE